MAQHSIPVRVLPPCLSRVQTASLRRIPTPPASLRRLLTVKSGLGPGGNSGADTSLEMHPIIRLWLLTVLVVSLFFAASEWLAGSTASRLPLRLLLVLAVFASLLLLMRNWWRSAVSERLHPLALGLASLGNGAPDALSSMKHDEISELAALVHRTCSSAAPSIPAADGIRQHDPEVFSSSRVASHLELAADHVESIRVLLEVCQTHQQPIPRAAFHNLHLVSKQLREVLREIEAGQRAA